MTGPIDVRELIDFDPDQIQRLLDALPFYAMLVDEEHTVLMVNAEVQTAFGANAEHLIGSYCPQSLHGCDHPYAGCPLEQACSAECGSAEAEIEDPARDLWLLSSVYPLRFRSPTGKRLFLHFTRDITARKKAEAARAQTLEHTRALKRLLEALQACDTEQEILATALDHVLELSWAGLRSQGAGFVRDGDDLRMVVSRNLPDAHAASCASVPLGHCLCGNAALQGQPLFCANMDHRHERLAGELPDHGHAVMPLCDREQVFGVLNLYLPAGQVLDADRRGFLSAVASAVGGALRRNRMQEQIALNHYRQMQTEKLAALGTLVAGVAHEVNNPLAGLKNCQKWLCRDNLPLARRQEYLELMEDGLKRIERVMQQLLSYGRLRPPRWASESLAQLLASTCGLLKPTMSSRKVTLEVEPPTSELTARVDAGQIQQALTNLLLNALYVTPEGGAVRVRLCSAGELVGFEVEDQGPGIPPELRAKIEDPFFTTKPEGQGTGLGLSVTRTIVDAHRGTLRFHFPPQGGTIASLMVPGGPSRAQAAEQPASAGGSDLP